VTTYLYKVSTAQFLLCFLAWRHFWTISKIARFLCNSWVSCQCVFRERKPVRLVWYVGVCAFIIEPERRRPAGSEREAGSSQAVKIISLFASTTKFPDRPDADTWLDYRNRPGDVIIVPCVCPQLDRARFNVPPNTL